MAPSIKIFVQVALLCCVVTTSMGVITDLQKSFSELENKVKVSQEEIKSLHQIIEQLEKRLEQLEVKGKVGDTICSSYSSCLLVRIYVNYNVNVSTLLYVILPHG